MCKLKRLLAGILAFIISLSFSVLVNADDTVAKFNLSTENSKINAGDEFVVSVDLVSNPGLIAFKYILTYDNTVVYPESYVKGEVFANNGTIACGLLDTSIDPTTRTELIMTFDANDLSDDFYQTGNIALITFKSLEGASANTELSLEPSFDDTFSIVKGDILSEGSKITITVAGEEPAHTHNAAHIEAKAATCGENGNIEYWYCADCGKYFSDEACETEISYEDTIIPATGEHSWDEGVVTLEPTETSEGVKTYTCTVCGETKTEAIPMLEHVHTLTHVEAKAATCTESGNKEYWKCESCGKYFSDEKGETEILADSVVIAATGHSWDEGVVTVEPTETSEGVKTFTCTVCGETTTASIPKLDHVHTNISHVERVEPTCTENGNIEYWYCEDCGNYFSDASCETEIAYETTIIAAKGHSWDDGVITAEPTETSNGEKTYTCTVCGETKTEIIPAITTTTTTESTTETTTETTTKTSAKRSSGGGGGGSAYVASSYVTTSESTTEATTETAVEITTSEALTEKEADSKTVKVSIGSKIVTIDNSKYEIDAAPYIQAESSSTLVPLRFVALAILGEDVDAADTSSVISWDSANKTATVRVGNDVISFKAGSGNMTVNGVEKTMENGVKAEITDGRMYIPFRALGKALGVDVDWDASAKTAIYKIK